MAERRMFAKAIINSARFLKMPPTSRLLYYDLGMAADDDGVVEAFTVMRTTGATEDDLRVLAARGFVTILNDDFVAFINDWKQNNLIKKDRYHPSVHAHLLVQLEAGTQVEPKWNPTGTQVEPEDRLGKDRLGKDTGVQGEPAPKRKRFVPPTLEELTQYIRENGYAVNPRQFMDYYESNGWRVSRNPMKDWKATVRRWNSREPVQHSCDDLNYD
ncbi:MAG: hypothetical protein IKA47_08320 [Oscillospiraceae bacterium]|nr:hypothetical protein [Oscillospiraceae bacterium]